jgi:lysophospholipase L1-like esterase
VRRIAASLALLLASIVVALVGLEALLRLLDYHPPLQSGWMLTSPYLVPDADVIMIPRFLLEPSFYQPRSDAPLVLAIGDSFTQSYPVDARDSYPAVLERALTRRGMRAVVANAGMGDSGPDQQLRLLQTRLLPRLHPAVVVWSLYANDLWDNVLRAVFTIEDETLRPRSGVRNWIYLRQRLFDLTPLPQSVKRDSYTFNLLMKAAELGAKAAVPAAYSHDPTAWGARKLRLELDEFARLAEAYGFTPYVVLIAPQAVYLAGAGPTSKSARTSPADAATWQDHLSAVEHRKLAALLEGRREVIDAWFGTERTADIFADDGRDVAAFGDRHFNEAGYALLGELVAERLHHDGALRSAGPGGTPSAR